MSGRVIVLRGDAAHLPLPDASVDAVVCDPPYGLEFMGKEWDTFKTGDGFRRSRNEADIGRDSVFGRTSKTSPEFITGNHQHREKPRFTADHMGKGFKAIPNTYEAGAPFQKWCESWARECLRVLKPGGYLLAFGGTRTSHRLTCGIEDAGFEIRDATADLTGREAPGLMWIYGSGMPKSRDAARSVDMQVCPLPGRHHMRKVPSNPKPDDHVCPESEEGQTWQGWGSTAKPAWEPIVVGRKPLVGTMGRNLLEYGTGALNLAACQVGTEPRVNNAGGAFSLQRVSRVEQGYRPNVTASRDEASEVAGRWPPNVIFSHAPECLPVGTRTIRGDNRTGGTAGAREASRTSVPTAEAVSRTGDCTVTPRWRHGTARPAARSLNWMRRAACSPRVRTRPGAGLTSSGSLRRVRRASRMRSPSGANSGGASRFFPVFHYEAKADTASRPRLPDGTTWPTVKPVPLIRWLLRLVVPPGGTVGDFFCGTNG